MNLKNTLDSPLLDAEGEKSNAKAENEVALTLSIHQTYAHVAPKILLEVMTARTLTVVLAVTYLSFALAFLFDVRSTILGYRDNNREATALSCETYNVSTARDMIDRNYEFGCTLNSTTSQPVWIGQFTNLDNIISISLDLEIRNISAAAFESLEYSSLDYDVRLYGCYDDTPCTDWIKVLSMDNKDIDLMDAYDSKNDLLRFTLIGNTFQNQEALPARGIVRSYFVAVRYKIEGADGVAKLDDYLYKFENIDKQSNKAADALTVILQLFTIAFSVWYCNMLFISSADTEVLAEQYWVVFYLIALILFQNPVYCVICWIKDPGAQAVFSYYIIDSLSQTAFYVIWLMFADVIQRKSWNFLFYTPKLFFGLVIFASNVIALTYQFPSLTRSIDRNPLLAVYNWSGDTKRVLVGACVTFLFLLWFWTLWWFFRLYRTGDALKRMRYMDSRYLQLSFRFFSLQATLVTLYYVFQYFVVIYFVLSRSSDGWVDDLNGVADSINTLFRQQTQSFGKICFITVYGIILAIFFIPVSWLKYEGHPALEATYVVHESEVIPLRKHRKKSIKAMGKIGSTLTKAKVDVLCLEIALELMELSYEAYYDPTGQHTASGFGLMNLERHGYLMLDSKYCAELDTVCYICRNISKNRVVVVFRGTSSKTHWNLNLDYGKVEINLERDFTLPDLDRDDGLSLDYLNFDLDEIDSDESFSEPSASGSSQNSDEGEEHRAMTHILESTLTRAGAGVTRAASFVGTASSNAYDATVGATAEAMMKRAHQTPILKNALACAVHRGFWTAYLSVRVFIHTVLRRELSINPGDVYFTGHSLGGALATLASVDFAIYSGPRINRYLHWVFWREHHRQPSSENACWKSEFKRPVKIRVGMYNYGSPRVGNGIFAMLYDKYVSNAFRIAVDGDIVTGIPPKTSRYKHIGTTVVIDGSGTGSVIIDPSFVERRLQFSSKSSVKAHYLNYYRCGIIGAIKASEIIREENLRKRTRNVTARKNIFLFPSLGSAVARTPPSLSASRDVVGGEYATSASSRDNRFSELMRVEESRDGDGEYVKQMENIFPDKPPKAGTSLLQSMKSVIWGEDDVSSFNSKANISVDVTESMSSSIKMKELNED